MNEKQLLCKHENFECYVNVGRILSSKDGDPAPSDAPASYHADISIKCAQCGEQFSFKGAPAGFSWAHPTVNPNGTELRVPLEPGPMLIPSVMRFEVGEAA